MRKIIYREGAFIDREKEENFILNRLTKSRPENILFIYGPKSSGKTTFIEYIVEEKLSKQKKNFYVNYVNFRGYAIYNYNSFLNIYFKPITEENKSFLAKMIEKFNVVLSGMKGEISIPEKGINIMISYNLFKGLEDKKIDPFDLFFDVLRNLKEKGKQPVLIIDEVQELSDIYMNGDIKKRYLLTEFFKFLIRLTKETHLAHIIVMTSSSVFIDEIYNNSKLAQTSKFYLFDHFDYETTKEWLKMENFNGDEIELIWEYFGGCPFNIQDLLSERDNLGEEFKLEEYLKEQAMVMRGKISFTVSDEYETIEEKRYFKTLMKEILDKGHAIKEDENELQKKVLRVAIEKDILFLKAEEGKIIFNSQIMKKGAEIYLG